MNIDCIPATPLSWNFDLSDGYQTAFLKFNWFSEQGIIKVGETEYQIQKQSLFSSQWNLVHRNESIYRVHKPSPFSRKFEILGPLESTVLSPTGLGRTRTLQGPNVDFSPFLLIILSPAEPPSAVKERTSSKPPSPFG